MPFVDESEFVSETPPAPKDTRSGFVDIDAVESPVVPQATIGPAPTYRERIERAFLRFKNKVSSDTVVGALGTPFRVVPGFVEAYKELAPEKAELLGNAINSATETGSKLISSLSRIEPVKEFAEQLKAVHEDDDTAIDTYGKALRNVALDIGVGAL